MTKDELIAAIRETPLSGDDFGDIIQVAMEAMLGSMLLGGGMDLMTGNHVSTGFLSGRWVPAPTCASDRKTHPGPEGWRHEGLEHEHWVEG